MKKYYSAVKPFYKRKRIRPVYKILKAIVKLFFPENEFVWTCEKPSADEALFFVGNHTKIYAPIAFLLRYDRPIRLWANSYFLSCKAIGNHMFKKVLINRKPKFLIYPLAFLLFPIIVWAFKSMEPIPVYHQDRKVFETFDKAIDTMESGIDQIIFPERTENQINKYLFEFNQGFVHMAKLYYEKTGKLMKFYPVYTCQAMRKSFIGKPVVYDPNVTMKVQKATVCNYLENEIKELADSLPEHKLSIYG